MTDRPEPRRTGALLRRWFGATLFGGLVWFPASLPIAPLVGLFWLGEAELRRRRPALGRVVTAVYLAIGLAATFTLGRLGPFLAPSDWAYAWGAAAAAGIVAGRVRGAGARVLWLAACLAVPLAAAPPMPPGWLTRCAILVIAWCGYGLFVWLVGSQVGRGQSAPAWALAVLLPSVALRALLFWLLPTANAAPILAALPGARLVMPSWPDPKLGTRFGMPINRHDLRVAMHGCDPASRIVGTLEAVYLGSPPDVGWREVRFPPGDQFALDCPRGKVWVPEMVQEKLWSVDLESFAVERPFEACDFAGPTVVDFDEERATLLGYPGGEHLAAYDPATGQCRIVVDGGTIMGFAVSSARQEAFVVRNGRLERCRLGGSEQCDVILKLYDEDLPRWMQSDRLNKATFVNHFNKIALDSRSNYVFATSLQSGRLYRVDRNTGAPAGELELERGIRWVQVDAVRRLVYVGGFVRGNFFVVDADTLSVRRRVFLGRKIRYFEPLGDGTLIAATSAGVIEFDPERAAPAVAPRLTPISPDPSGRAGADADRVPSGASVEVEREPLENCEQAPRAASRSGRGQGARREPDQVEDVAPAQPGEGRAVEHERGQIEPIEEWVGREPYKLLHHWKKPGEGHDDTEEFVEVLEPRSIRVVEHGLLEVILEVVLGRVVRGEQAGVDGLLEETGARERCCDRAAGELGPQPDVERERLERAVEVLAR